MSEVIRLRKGLNIKLKGNAGKIIDTLSQPATVAVKPTDFPGLTPKLDVKPGNMVRAGDVLFHDKYNPEVFFTAPSGGEVSLVKRGERRRIMEIVIDTGKNSDKVEFSRIDPNTLSREQIKEHLLRSGLWPFIKRRPYGIIASPNEKPDAIFISTFDTAPLAPDYDFILKENWDVFQTGIDALSKLTQGSVFLGMRENSNFSEIRNVNYNVFSGPHPSGNVGVQIHHVMPVFKNRVIWTLNVQDVIFIGRLFRTGNVDFTKTIALTGSEVNDPKYLKTVLGAPISFLLENRLKKVNYNQRIISGNVLTGRRVKMTDYLGYYDSQVTIIPEGDDYELFGWATPGTDKFSASKTFLAKLFPRKEYEMNANLHGGERAFVISGQYEKVVPMDILPVFLLKSILANDIDKMEQLGIYEVIEEDLALCEYVCTSKIKVQDILRKGINTMIKELG